MQHKRSDEQRANWSWPRALADALLAFVRAGAAGLALGAIAFGAGFGFGVFRVLIVAPLLGALAAVGVELAVFLPLLALTAANVCRTFRIDTRDARHMVGLTALAFLLGLEALFAIQTTREGMAAYLRGLTSPPGLLGLAGQLMLAWLPALFAGKCLRRAGLARDHVDVGG